MSNEAVVIAVVAGSMLVLLVLVIAPWRSPGQDSLDDEDYYALMTGEEPPEEHAHHRPEHEGDEGPGLGDVEIP